METTISNSLQTFTNETIGANVRVVIQNGEPLFVAKDVCKALDLSDTGRAVERLDSDESTRIEIDHPQSPQKNIEVIVVNEYGLYNLIPGSRKPSAKQFKRWITHEVIPSIRKHGIYATDEAVDKIINDPDFGIKLLQELKAERQRRAELQNRVENLEERVAIQGQQIAEMKPKSAYYDMILNAKGLVSITTIAKDYGMSGSKMNALLHKLGIQWKQNNTWVLYQNYAENSYTNTKTTEYQNHDGEYKVAVHTYWTQKGRLFIYETLKKIGILPKIERDNEAA